MIAYLIRRVLQAIIVVWLVTVLTFVLLKLLPGGPVRAILGQRASDTALVNALTHQLGLDKPIWYQYWHWLDGLLHGNFGFSYAQNQTVSSLLGQRLPKTLLLLGTSTLLALIIAIPVGVAQAVRRNKTFDYVGTGLSFLFYAMPAFLIGLILIQVFALNLRIFPPEAAQGSTIGSFFTDFNAMVLPILSLALITIAAFSRYMRSSTLDQITQDYVRTARAKGAGEQRILYRHILRNALIPIATLIGLSLGFIFSGALITEFVFNYPGMGLLFITAATTQDYPILLGVTVIVALATVVGIAGGRYPVCGARPASEVRELMSINVPPPLPQDPGKTLVAPGADVDLVESGAPGVAPGMEAAPTRSMFRRGLEVFAENKLALVGMVLLLAIVFFCFIGPYLLPHQPGQHRPAERQPAAR